jgi:thioredoxin 1
MNENEELKRIREKKLKELMNRAKESDMKSKHPSEPIVLTGTKFNETVENYSMVVVDCWAPWCGPCNIVSPIIEELAKDYVGKIVFGKLNVDNNRDIALKYQIMSIPTLLVFKNGKLADRIVGAMPRSLLEPKIIRYL